MPFGRSHYGLSPTLLFSELFRLFVLVAESSQPLVNGAKIPNLYAALRIAGNLKEIERSGRYVLSRYEIGRGER
ncbi:MAG TPA: hypothetical protein V6C97_08755 [Oculatellaceae cyanobacterium]